MEPNCWIWNLNKCGSRIRGSLKMVFWHDLESLWLVWFRKELFCIGIDHMLISLIAGFGYTVVYFSSLVLHILVFFASVSHYNLHFLNLSCARARSQTLEERLEKSVSKAQGFKQSGFHFPSVIHDFYTKGAWKWGLTAVTKKKYYRCSHIIQTIWILHGHLSCALLTFRNCGFLWKMSTLARVSFQPNQTRQILVLFIKSLPECVLMSVFWRKDI